MLLRARVVQVVVDDLVAERLPRHRAVLERGDRLTQRVWETLRVRLVGVAFEWRRQLELVLDPVEAGDERREREVRVGVSARDPRFRPQRLAVPDDPEAAGAVVVAPGKWSVPSSRQNLVQLIVGAMKIASSFRAAM